MPSKRMVPEQEIAELSDEMVRQLALKDEEIAALTEQRDRAMKALRACDRYFSACARAWAADEGRIANESGHILVEAEGLDELADEAGELVGRALAALDTPSFPSLPEETAL